jgi:hypothetical protein
MFFENRSWTSEAILFEIRSFSTKTTHFFSTFEFFSSFNYTWASQRSLQQNKKKRMFSRLFSVDRVIPRRTVRGVASRCILFIFVCVINKCKSFETKLLVSQNKKEIKIGQRKIVKISKPRKWNFWKSIVKQVEKIPVFAIETTNHGDFSASV